MISLYLLGLLPVINREKTSIHLYLSVDVVVSKTVMERNKSTKSSGDRRGTMNKTSYGSKDTVASCNDVQALTKGNVDFGALLTFVKSLKSRRSHDTSNEVS